MKVLQINAVYRTGSTGRTTYELQQYLIANGQEGFVAATHIASPDSHVRVIGNPFDWKLHGLFSRIFGLQGYFSLHSTKQLLQWIEQEKPDVVHLRNLHGNYIHLPKLLQYLAAHDIATVVTLHDCWLFTGKCCHYILAGCERWQTECHDCPLVKQYNKSWFFDRSRKMFLDKKRDFQAIPRLAVVGVSNWVRDEAKKAPIFSNAKEIICIYNWIDTDIFHPVDTTALREELHLTDKKVILSVASYWEQEKGLDTLLQIAAQLQENEHILMIGDVSDTMQLPPQIIHLPSTRRVEELVPYYALADVYVQPSLAETFGKVVVEAMACGTPVVCFDSTANPELVTEGCGYVLPPGDAKGMLCKIREIFENGKEQYTLQCVANTQKNFNAEKNMAQYLKLYQALTDEKE